MLLVVCFGFLKFTVTLQNKFLMFTLIATSITLKNRKRHRLFILLRSSFGEKKLKKKTIQRRSTKIIKILQFHVTNNYYIQINFSTKKCLRLFIYVQ